MTAPRRYGLRSLRFKLVLASVVVETLMLTALVWNSTRIAGESIQELLQHRIEVLVPLMNVSLANPLAQRDYATLDERLRLIVRKESLVYIEVRDELGRIAASRGDLPAVPNLDRSIESARNVFDQEFDITVAGQVIGRARFGLNVSLLEATLASLRNQGVLVASAGIVLSVLLLATLGALLTRRLLTLAHAAGTLAGGDYTVRLPAPSGRDEIADVARAFNAMASALERDIAERRRVEVALRESEERFRATFEQAAVGIAQVAPDGRWLHVNQKLCDIVGYRREDLLQRTFQDITHPDDLDADLASVRRMLAGEIQTYGMEKRYLRKDGSLIWIYLTVGLVRQPTGDPKYFISVVEDISERKRAEVALRHSEQRLRNIIDGLGPSMFVGLLSTEGVVLDANQQALAAAGLKPEDVLGKPVEETYWFSYSEESKRQMRATVTRAAQGEASRYDLQIRVAENQFIPLDFSVQPFRDAAGHVVLLVPSAIVITERKQAEDGLRQLTHELEQRVAERTAALAETNAELEAFSYTVSHDLRAPLRAVQGLAQALREDYADKLDALGQEYAQRLVVAAERMDGLIQDLLAYSRLTRAALKPESVELGTVVTHACEQLAADIAKSGARINVKKSLPAVTAHSATLVQVVTNLIANALKFVDPMVRPELEIWAESRADGVRLWVQDNGIGIEAEHQERIFRVFERLHGIETYPGTGIGLAIVRKGVERMGGTTGVESMSGQGSRFWVELPLSKRNG